MEKSKHRIQYSYLQTYAPYSDDSKVVKKVDPKVSWKFICFKVELLFVKPIFLNLKNIV